MKDIGHTLRGFAFGRELLDGQANLHGLAVQGSGPVTALDQLAMNGRGPLRVRGRHAGSRENYVRFLLSVGACCR